ncbi:baseplate J/gp47 family protein [Trinickia dinghuensis]|uniref:Uncharacterized protein n=1 Tax=Trinickia dinghuensis TaxID=2291023 RepID=A0A3D8JWQ8_9BURK|nr:baseplate J/gp47 family protein [Trinickia dinghuensis]RDU97548.1 hypothetical protein DWV00_16825 [Trinickia dinghuensis]
MIGTTQAARRLAALSPESAPVDARTLPEQLDFVRQFAQLLIYVGTDGKHDGHWEPFFANDISFALAPIVNFDGRRILADAERLAAAEPHPAHREEGLLSQLFELFRQVSEWVVGVKHIGASLPLGTSAGLALETLVTVQLAPLYSEVAGNPEWERTWHRLSREFWRKHSADGDYLKWLWHGSVPPSDAVATRSLRDILQSFVQYIVAAQATMRRYFADSLQDTVGHQPHSALMIAFVRLLRHAQESANTITARHLDFYYRDILRLRERPATPDRAFVCLQPTPAGRDVKVPALTQLRAGKLPDGRDLIYALDDDLVVNQDAVGALKTIRATQAIAQGVPYVPRLYASPHADSRDGLGALLVQPNPSWPTFGTDCTGAPLLLDSSPPAEIGFVVTSPMLLLRGGRRALRLRFEFEAKPSSLPRSPIEKTPGGTAAAPLAFADVVRAFLEVTNQAYADFAGRSLDAMVRRALRQACEVSVTTAKGWQSVKRVAVLADLARCRVDLVLMLPASFPPVEPGPPAVSEAGGASPWPRLKLMLKPDARVYPYSFIQHLLIKGITVQTRVAGLVPASMTTTQGPVDATAPFAPFGNLPILGSYLEMVDPELASKPIKGAVVRVEWFNLPIAPQNLAGHYAGYLTSVTNNMFQGAFSIRTNDRWNPPCCGKPLFTQDDSITAGLQTRRSFRVVEPTRNGALQPLDGIRMELAGPTWAFGHALYPQVLADASMKAALAISTQIKQEPELRIQPYPYLPSLPKMPNPPFLPQAKSITVDYVARQQLQARQAPDVTSAPIPCFYKIGPFGYVAQPLTGTLLLEGIARAGQLYIGLRNLVPGQIVSLLFGMQEAQGRTASEEPSAPGSGSAPGAVDWYYLLDNAWHRFGDGLVEDGTAGLTRSGIVRLQTGARRMNSDNTLLPAGLYWIAAVVDDPQARSRAAYVGTQAVAVTQVLNGAAPLASAPLPVGSINDFVRKPPGIQGVGQPLPTCGGQAAELTDAFQVRVSERLRHKQRAVSAADFEQIALDVLPALLQAKCITPDVVRAKGYDCARLPAGTLKLVVVPQPAQGKNHPARPKISLDELALIRSALLQRTVVTLRDLSVANPVYEEVKVVLQIDLRAEPETHLNSGKAAAYDLSSLDRDMSSWLAPWRDDRSIALPVGGDPSNRNVNDLQAFIVNRVGAERVARLQLNVLHSYERGGARATRWFGRDEALMPSSPWAVLIPAASHFIGSCDERYGIDSMAIGEDAMVLPEPPPPANKLAQSPSDRRYRLHVPLKLVSQPSDVDLSKSDD